ncbi:putative TAP46-like protein [Helianthus annuus]|nr:putative TAP46-like protein [Helianthus annuus]
MRSFANYEKIVSKSGLFSINETKEETSTTNLNYILVNVIHLCRSLTVLFLYPKIYFFTVRKRFIYRILIWGTCPNLSC